MKFPQSMKLREKVPFPSMNVTIRTRTLSELERKEKSEGCDSVNVTIQTRRLLENNPFAVRRAWASNLESADRQRCPQTRRIGEN
jgi:hypothetical protein